MATLPKRARIRSATAARGLGQARSWISFAMFDAHVQVHSMWTLVCLLYVVLFWHWWQDRIAGLVVTGRRVSMNILFVFI